MDWIIDLSLTLGLEKFTFIQVGVSYMYFNLCTHVHVYVLPWVCCVALHCLFV